MKRSASRREYLMCPPKFFAVAYSINPWMDTAVEVDADLALRQWEVLRETLLALGHTVELAEPVPELPDMVFAANAAIVIDDRVLVAKFRHSEREPESDAYAAWFRAHGYRDVQRAGLTNEGEGDHLVAGGHILAAEGLRTERSSHRETGGYFERGVVGLTLVDPRFYHLDTALSVLDDDRIMYYPGAFSPRSRAVLRQLFPDAIEARESDAVVLGLNAISDGRHVVLPAEARELAARLTHEGYEPIGVELSELRKAGGGPKCCVLELRHDTASGSMCRAAA
ncbi:MAG TPA: amidinotransferase [Actinospica sp.]|nr:amidinotransferase [Actinospica sp.]